MAGHSKFKNIQHRKGAQDKKRAKLFTRLVREIITAAKSGQADPEFNPRLRTAMNTARAMNLPKERIEKAIAQASNPNDSADYIEIRYEGFAPGGIAIIVEVLTDNRNRTASDVRAAFNKYGGNLGETGNVSYMFDHTGIIQYPMTVCSNEAMMDYAIEIGADDIESDELYHTIYMAIEDYNKILDELSKKFGPPEEGYIGWRPQNTIMITDLDKATKLMKLIDTLEENEDVQKVFGNYEFSEEVLSKLEG